ncbi:hypothetical protein [Staphylococcus succinus]|uniref:hypothetical protein n=1 Tax=Staphylococcus succinus TaxID=61015 RepID=UPI000E67E9AC|nr:hypothetical protein [Staphylococcus succinus]RIN27696.1 hypothetical protein BU067_01435 [Staphylococcus succinus]
MGAILETGSLACSKTDIKRRLINIVDLDEKNVVQDEDFYNGGFHATQGFKQIGKEMKDKDKRTIETNHYNFIENNDFEKYVIHYKVIGSLGYKAHALKVFTYTSLKGKVILEYPKEYIWGQSPRTIEFKNITSLKRYVKESSEFRELNGSIIRNKDGFKLGEISTQERIYKTKPKKLPQKYQWLDEYVCVTYGAYNPV